MAFDHQFQRSRYELKFIVDELTAKRVRDFARPYLQRDDHAIPEMGYSYPIYSLYLDSPGLSLFNATVQGMKNRYKLRIRYYDEDGWSPVFFEIKRRVDEVILKERAGVRREVMRDLLRGRCPQRSDLIKPHDLDSYSALRRFSDLSNNIHAEGKVIVYYHREAWVSPQDDNVRVTFDRNLRGARYEGSLKARKWVTPPYKGVVLELKFDNRFPLWMREMVRCCDLYRTSFPKYVECMTTLPRQDALMANAF